jgi:hypothetical protein
LSLSSTAAQGRVLREKGLLLTFGLSKVRAKSPNENTAASLTTVFFLTDRYYGLSALCINRVCGFNPYILCQKPDHQSPVAFQRQGFLAMIVAFIFAIGVRW